MNDLIALFRSNKIISEDKTYPGLYDLFKIVLNTQEKPNEGNEQLSNPTPPYNDNNIFTEDWVVVPTQTSGIWIRDRLTDDFGVCANIDFIVLLGPLLNKIYRLNHPKVQLNDLDNTKYLIYKYLCQGGLGKGYAQPSIIAKVASNTKHNTHEITQYLYKNGVLDKTRAYYFACDFAKVFHEYIYLRTEQVLNLEKSTFPEYQKELIKYILANQNGKKTFLDIYKYFMEADLSKVKLPSRIFIFNLTSIYTSQLQIIKKLAEHTHVYWFYKTCSFEYYGDLYDKDTKIKLEEKYFKDPELSLDDLYLNDGNPLLSNLGQESRQFIELLNQYGITFYDYPGGNLDLAPTTMLQVLQNDILKLNYRVNQKKRLNPNSPYYQEPLEFNDTSIKINICHNRMREVQVLFNEVAQLLNQGISPQDILITAPDIDVYAKFIEAVFANESVHTQTGYSYKLECNVTGKRNYAENKVLEIFTLILNAPYQITVNYLLEILMSPLIQAGLGLNLNDVELIRVWLQDNYIYFGYDEKDYTEYGYDNYSLHSFKQFLLNIVLGGCIQGTNLGVQTAIDGANPYDNIDSRGLVLCNKLIGVIALLEEVRNKFYQGYHEYNELSFSEVILVLEKISNSFTLENRQMLLLEKFMGSLQEVAQVVNDESELQQDSPGSITITLPILQQIISEYSNKPFKYINLNGAITAISMQYIRNIPYKYVCVLGLNSNEFPRVHEPNMLSILAKSWYLADRNYTNEDKQTFLDIFLATDKQLILSYIGYDEKDNSVISPSSVVTELLEVINASFVDFHEENKNINYTNLIIENSLHPFYNNKNKNYSSFWHDISNAQKNAGVNRVLLSNFKSTEYLSTDDYLVVINPVKFIDITNTFYYSNTNLYKILNLNKWDEEDLPQVESFNLKDRTLAKILFKLFEEHYNNYTYEELYEFLVNSGVIAYGHLGEMQFKEYYTLYTNYNKLRGEKVDFVLDVTATNLMLNVRDNIYLENGVIIVTSDFINIRDNNFEKNELKYELKIKGMIIKALVNMHDKYKAYPVIIRDLNQSGEHIDYRVETTFTTAILEYFIASFKRPTMIHKGAIEKYATTERNPYDEAAKVYANNYNNYDLDKIKEDVLWSSIALNYFEYTQKHNCPNDIILIGQMLYQTQFTKV